MPDGLRPNGESAVIPQGPLVMPKDSNMKLVASTSLIASCQLPICFPRSSEEKFTFIYVQQLKLREDENFRTRELLDMFFLLEKATSFEYSPPEELFADDGSINVYAQTQFHFSESSLLHVCQVRQTT